MAGLVGQHADQLVRRLRLHQRAVIDEDAAAVGDKSVEGGIVDDDHLDVLLFHARGAQDRPGVVAQQLLRLGVAQHRGALLLGGAERRRHGERDRGGEGGQFQHRFAVRGTVQHQRSLSIWRRGRGCEPDGVCLNQNPATVSWFDAFFFTRPGFSSLENAIRSHRMRPVWGGNRCRELEIGLASRLMDSNSR